MTKEQAFEAIENLAKEKKVFKNSLAYKSAIEAIMHPGKEISCGANIGTGRYSATKTWQAGTANVLRLAGIPYRCGNNAPRHGKNGDFIRVDF